jgi:hypothetical protein
MYPRLSIIYVGFSAQLLVCHFGSFLPSKSDFGPPKMENALFIGQKKIGMCGVPRHPKGHTRVRYSIVSTNYAMIRAKPSAFDLKVMQPRMW